VADLANLRLARKRAKRRQDEHCADANRLAYGQPKRQRRFEAAQRIKADHDLDLHLIDKGGRK
jgi:hypothetical protein